MGGVYGIDQIEKILVMLCEIGNVLEQVISKKKLIAIFSLSDELLQLASLDVDLFKKQVAELDVADRAALVARLKAKLDLEDDKAEALIEDGADLAVEAVAFIAKIVAFVGRVKS